MVIAVAGVLCSFPKTALPVEQRLAHEELDIKVRSWSSVSIYGSDGFLSVPISALILVPVLPL